MISRSSFDYVRDAVARSAGIRFEKGSEFLLESRLLPLAKEYNAGSANEFIRKMQSGEIDGAEQILIEALVDTETCFFRDFRPFETLRKTIVPELSKARAGEQKLTIWSIGCSTGQETFSMAMLLYENFPDLRSWQIEIVGSDISYEALRTAQAGRYNQLEVNRGLPVALLVKYFQKDGLAWRLKDEICRMVQYYQMNLLEKWPPLRGFDLILFRNLLLSFAPDTQREILKRIRGRLKPDGYLLLGAKEAPANVGDFFQLVRLEKVVAYKPKPGVAEAEDTGEARAIREAVQKPSAGGEDDAASLQELAKTVRETYAKAVNETFVAMLSAELETFPSATAEALWPGQTVLGMARFSASAEGALCLRLKPEFAEQLAGQVLGIPPEDVEFGVVKDMLTQLFNILVTHVKTELDGAGVPWESKVIEVTQPNRSELELPPKTARESIAFRYQGHFILADIVVYAKEPSGS